MKTIDTVSKSLLEVWEQKEEIYKDTKDKSLEEKKKYFKQGLKDAVKILKGKLVKSSEGYFIISK